ncbi:hypothetical protein KFK09_006852 [Dendrobium nobile]|uniref:Uncharacterized protein n=1 Tax=Dendrobium nobile TaxID=94219 RepID=A0A8T3BTK6_DENNO|nr:hypothetical protein KFK09_006852 [Dendrobium nobile]
MEEENIEAMILRIEHKSKKIENLLRCRDCRRRFFGSFVAVRLRSCDDFNPDRKLRHFDRKLQHFDRKQERELAGCEGTWRHTSGSWCKFEPYGFPETSKKEEDKPTKIYRRFGPRSDSFIKFSTANVCPAVVIVSPEMGNGGSGIIIDSNGTILTHASNIFSPDFTSKINVCLHDRRKFSGTILEINEDYDLALLKIQSEIPLPTTMFGTLGNYKARELISIHRLLREKAYPRTSSQNEVDEELQDDYPHSVHLVDGFLVIETHQIGIRVRFLETMAVEKVDTLEDGGEEGGASRRCQPMQNHGFTQNYNQGDTRRRDGLHGGAIQPTGSLRLTGQDEDIISQIQVSDGLKWRMPFGLCYVTEKYSQITEENSINGIMRLQCFCECGHADFSYRVESRNTPEDNRVYKIEFREG